MNQLHLLPLNKAGVTHRGNLNFAQHLANNGFNVFIVNLHTLQTINVLNFIGNIASQSFNALKAQDVMRIAWTIRNNFTFSNHLPLKYRQLTMLGNQNLVMS